MRAIRSQLQGDTTHDGQSHLGLSLALEHLLRGQAPVGEMVCVRDVHIEDPSLPSLHKFVDQDIALSLIAQDATPGGCFLGHP